MSDEIESDKLATEWPELPEPGMLEKIVEIIIQEGLVDPDAVKPDATLEGLGLNSVDMVSILMGVEEEFDVYVPMGEDLASVRTLGEMIAQVVAQMHADEEEQGDE